MGRWEPDARQRLETAAIELFVEQGFAATTVPEITARAGLTTRTFFRYFADKREVLFGGDQAAAAAQRMLAEAPADVEPLALIVSGLRAVAAERFEGRRDDLRIRRDIVNSDDGLRERDQRKRSVLREEVRKAMVARGVDKVTAALLGETCATLLFVSVEEWLDQDGDRPLADIVLDTLASLRVVLS
ncbi:TetR family transcriptional regulator [Actinoplanes sp. NPDC049265]|uniref:TetR family transcriptional regulator n=1 Tax=Actinoplanes sp. NPDC049265 TaxID=3363902 RepID=UPI00371A7BE4